MNYIGLQKIYKDHLLTSFPVKHETIKTTFSDHYTVVGEIHIDTKNSQDTQQNYFKTRNLKNIKGDKAVNFLFLFDQKMMKLHEEKLTNDNISRTILVCVDLFTPERYASYKLLPTNDWINNSIKNGITERDILFQQWINDPKQGNKQVYRRQHNLVTSLVSSAKRSCNYQTLGVNPTAKIIYRTLKTQLAKNQYIVLSQYIETPNINFSTIGSTLSETLPKSEYHRFTPTFAKTDGYDENIWTWSL